MEPGLETGKIQLNVNGKPEQIEVELPRGRVPFERMLTAFRMLADAIIGFSIDNSAKNDKPVSCKKGCDACCRQLIPVSLVEADRLRKVVEDLPTMRKTTILRRFRKLNKLLSESGWIDNYRSSLNEGHKERRSAALEYFSKGLDCPFLEKGACSIYEERPLACREYLVTSPAEHCNNPTKDSIEPLEVPIQISKAMYKSSAGMSTSNRTGYTALPLILDDREPKNSETERKTASEWLGRIIKLSADGREKS